MIRRLRLKFVCINMLIVTVMLFFMLGLTINMTNDQLEAGSLQMLREMYMPDKHEEDKGKKEEKPIEERPVEEKEAKEEKEKKEKPYGQHGGHLPTFTLRYDESGALVAMGSDTFDLTDTAYLQEVLDAAIALDAESGDLDEYELRFLRINEPRAYIFADISAEQATMENLMKDCLLIGLIAFVAFLGISIFLSFWAVKPVERAWTQQRQFVGDASHELKTPLTVIMTNAEMLKDPTMSEETRENCVENVNRMSQQMRALIEELLTLARADDVKSMEKQSVQLDALLEDALLPFEALFYERGLTVKTDIGENLRMEGDATLLRRLIDILLDNAQKHSLVGEVRLSLKKQGCHAHLRICNPAEPISEEDLAHIFERFYRIDKARTDTRSHGLGLSIADGIVRKHGGSIRAEYAEGRLAFHVKLPLR